MQSELLKVWLVHYDPIHRGWTRAGIANGLTATRGFVFPRIRGGYNLYRREAGAAPPSEAPVGAAGADAAQTTTFPWVNSQASRSYLYRLTAINGGGAESPVDGPVARVGTDAQGHWLGLRPNPTADLAVRALAEGAFELIWTYDPRGEQVPPVVFRVYHDGGSGTVNYATAADAVAFQWGKSAFRYRSAKFVDGQLIRWAVRAVSAAGLEEPNAQVVQATARVQGPAVNAVLLAGLGSRV